VPPTAPEAEPYVDRRIGTAVYIPTDWTPTASKQPAQSDAERLAQAVGLLRDVAMQPIPLDVDDAIRAFLVEFDRDAKTGGG
jgi:hypothetical protein